MKALPKDLKLIMEIGRLLTAFFKSPDTPVEIRSTDLFELISKKPLLSKEFPTAKIFNQFLRKHHQNGKMYSFISYRVDETNKNFYQWYFSQKPTNLTKQAVNNTTIEGTFNYYKNSKKHYTNDDIQLNSTHEVFIYEQLKKHSHLLIKLEYPVVKNGETKHVDFTILNKLSRKEFLWEHFGMTNDESYKSDMANKIEWYTNNGFKTIEEGGNLIYTYYRSENRLKKDVDKYIKKIKDS